MGKKTSGEKKIKNVKVRRPHNSQDKHILNGGEICPKEGGSPLLIVADCGVWKRVANAFNAHLNYSIDFLLSSVLPLVKYTMHIGFLSTNFCSQELRVMYVVHSVTSMAGEALAVAQQNIHGVLTRNPKAYWGTTQKLQLEGRPSLSLPHCSSLFV